MWATTGVQVNILDSLTEFLSYHSLGLTASPGTVLRSELLNGRKATHIATETAPRPWVFVYSRSFMPAAIFRTVAFNARVWGKGRELFN